MSRHDKRVEVLNKSGYAGEAGKTVDQNLKSMTVESFHNQKFNSLYRLRRNTFSKSKIMVISALVKSFAKNSNTWSFTSNEVTREWFAKAERRGIDISCVRTEESFKDATGQEHITSKIDDVKISRLRSVLQEAVGWELRAGVDKGRFDTDSQHRTTGKEDVLFAHVQRRMEGLASPSRDGGSRALEVVASDISENDGAWMHRKIDRILSSLWNDPVKVSFRGMKTLYAYASELYLGIRKEDVENYIRNHELYLTRRPPLLSGGVTSPLVPTSLGWHQLDLTYISWDESISESDLSENALRNSYRELRQEYVKAQNRIRSEAFARSSKPIALPEWMKRQWTADRIQWCYFYSFYGGGSSSVPHFVFPTSKTNKTSLVFIPISNDYNLDRALETDARKEFSSDFLTDTFVETATGNDIETFDEGPPSLGEPEQSSGEIIGGETRARKRSARAIEAEETLQQISVEKAAADALLKESREKRALARTARDQAQKASEEILETPVIDRLMNVGDTSELKWREELLKSFKEISSASQFYNKALVFEKSGFVDNVFFVTYDASKKQQALEFFQESSKESLWKTSPDLDAGYPNYRLIVLTLKSALNEMVANTKLDNLIDKYKGIIPLYASNYSKLEYGYQFLAGGELSDDEFDDWDDDFIDDFDEDEIDTEFEGIEGGVNTRNRSRAPTQPNPTQLNPAPPTVLKTNPGGRGGRGRGAHRGRGNPRQTPAPTPQTVQSQTTGRGRGGRDNGRNNDQTDRGGADRGRGGRGGRGAARTQLVRDDERTQQLIERLKRLGVVCRNDTRSQIISVDFGGVLIRDLDAACRIIKEEIRDEYLRPIGANKSLDGWSPYIPVDYLNAEGVCLYKGTTYKLNLTDSKDRESWKSFRDAVNEFKSTPQDKAKVLQLRKLLSGNDKPATQAAKQKESAPINKRRVTYAGWDFRMYVANLALIDKMFDVQQKLASLGDAKKYADPKMTLGDNVVFSNTDEDFSRFRLYPYLLNVVDIFSKFVWSFPIKSKASEEIAECLERLWLQEGPPEILQSDNGTEFKGPIMESLAQRYNVERRTCAPYNSQCSGAIERVNRTIKDMVTKARYGLELRNETWIHYLQQIVYSYNVNAHSSTKLTPYLIQRGREPRSLGPMLASVSVQTATPSAAERKLAEDQKLTGVWKKVLRIEGQGDTTLQPLQAGAQTLSCEVCTDSNMVDAITQYSKDAETTKVKREEFVQRQLLQSALAMTADSLIKASKDLEPVAVGKILRVSMAQFHIQRRELNTGTGIKRAKDRSSWSEDLYYVARAPPTDPSKKILQSQIKIVQRTDEADEKNPNHYLVVKIGGKFDPTSTNLNALHVPRHYIAPITLNKRIGMKTLDQDFALNYDWKLFSGSTRFADGVERVVRPSATDKTLFIKIQKGESLTKVDEVFCTIPEFKRELGFTERLGLAARVLTFSRD